MSHSCKSLLIKQPTVYCLDCCLIAFLWHFWPTTSWLFFIARAFVNMNCDVTNKYYTVHRQMVCEKKNYHWCYVVTGKSQPSGPPSIRKLGRPNFPLEHTNIYKHIHFWKKDLWLSYLLPVACILRNGEVIQDHKFISVEVIELSVRCLNTGPEDRLLAYLYQPVGRIAARRPHAGLTSFRDVIFM